MKKVTLDLNLVITDDRDVSVEIHYRCWISEKVCLYPMDVLTSIYEGESLSACKERHLKDYQKDYKRVEIGAVFVDMAAFKAKKKINNP